MASVTMIIAALNGSSCEKENSIWPSVKNARCIEAAEILLKVDIIFNDLISRNIPQDEIIKRLNDALHNK